MPKKTSMTGMFKKFKKISSLNENAGRTKETLDEQKKLLRESIIDYKEKYPIIAEEIIEEKLDAQGSSWCTDCHNIYPKTDLKLILERGTTKNGCCSYASYYEQKRLCPECQKKAFSRHNKFGPYDNLIKTQEASFAYIVEQRQDGYYAYKGSWVKVPSYIPMFGNGGPFKNEGPWIEPLYRKPADFLRELAKKLNIELPPDIETIAETIWRL